MVGIQRLLAGVVAALLAAAAGEGRMGQATHLPLSLPQLPVDLLYTPGRGGSRTLSLAEATSLRRALGGGQPAVAASEAAASHDPSQLKAVAMGTAAVGAVAGMSGWDRMELGLWLAQTGMDGYQYSMDMWNLIGPGMPH
uniref:Phospholipase B-like n=1 Tax=Alexandrium monilatum TaxID=311494 RepID=A0A7S4QIG8_9DINO